MPQFQRYKLSTALGQKGERNVLYVETPGTYKPVLHSQEITRNIALPVEYLRKLLVTFGQ